MPRCRSWAPPSLSPATGLVDGLGLVLGLDAWGSLRKKLGVSRAGASFSVSSAVDVATASWASRLIGHEQKIENIVAINPTLESLKNLTGRSRCRQGIVLLKARRIKYRVSRGNIFVV